MVLLTLVISIILLYYGADLMVRGAVSIAHYTGLSTLAIGLTVVAYGTSAPEMLTSVYAVIDGNSDIAISNVIGSNIYNIAGILSITAIVTPIAINTKVVKRDVPLMILITIFSIFLLWDNLLSQQEGMILLTGLLCYTIYILYSSKNTSIESHTAVSVGYSLPLSLLVIVISLLLLFFGSKLLVDSAIKISRFFGISEAVIGLTVVSIGTSIPELVTSFVAAIRKETDMAVGNIVGSNIFNILGILGVSSLVSPCIIDGVSRFDYLVMLLLSLAILPILRTGYFFSRREGFVLLALYILYLVNLLV